MLALLRQGRTEAAARQVASALEELFAMRVAAVEFTQDEYSLNSVSGRVHTGGDGGTLFFKFHQEDGEQDHVAEYYRARLLSDAGLPVEVPVATSSRPGAQVAIYRLRTEPRMADLCAGAERDLGAAASLAPDLLRARHDLDDATAQLMLATLRPPVEESAGTALHQLFHHRLVDRDGAFPGGRYRSFYAASPAYAAVAHLRWRVDGVEYVDSLNDLAERAAVVLRPSRLAALPVVTAHGDDHHGNIWAMGNPPGSEGLRLFDPAFASDDIPALLAPVKATFHNALAHPFWLYHPAEADQLGVTARVADGVVDVVTGQQTSPMRQQILDSVAERVWAPLLAEMARRGWLPADWEQVVRSALFCCPMLVTNLVAPARPEAARWLGLASAVVAGSRPASAGSNRVSELLERVAP